MNGEHVQREFEAYRTDDAAARAILDKAAEEKRSTPSEEDEQFDALFTSGQVHKSRADQLAKMDTDGTTLAEAVRSRIGTTDETASGDPSGTAVVRYETQLIENIRSIAEAIHKGGEVPGEICI